MRILALVSVSAFVLCDAASIRGRGKTAATKRNRVEPGDVSSTCVHFDEDIGGSDINIFGNGNGDPSVCYKACHANPNCGSWLAAIGSCFLKSGVPEVQKSDFTNGFVWGTKDCNPRLPADPSADQQSEPECAPGCHRSWLQDGMCDSACNQEACGFDGSDCAAVLPDDPANCLHHGEDIPGNDGYIFDNPANDPAVCQRACKETPVNDCSMWLMAIGKCFLKNGSPAAVQSDFTQSFVWGIRECNPADAAQTLGSTSAPSVTTPAPTTTLSDVEATVLVTLPLDIPEPESPSKSPEATGPLPENHHFELYDVRERLSSSVEQLSASVEQQALTDMQMAQTVGALKEQLLILESGAVGHAKPAGSMESVVPRSPAEVSIDPKSVGSAGPTLYAMPTMTAGGQGTLSEMERLPQPVMIPQAGMAITTLRKVNRESNSAK